MLTCLIELNQHDRYTYIEKNANDLYLVPNIFERAKVYNKAHTHPKNSEHSPADLLFSHLIGISGTVIGWNNIINNYGGYGYWK